MATPVSSKGKKATTGGNKGWVTTFFNSDKDHRMAAAAKRAASYRTGM